MVGQIDVAEITEHDRTRDRCCLKAPMYIWLLPKWAHPPAIGRGLEVRTPAGMSLKAQMMAGTAGQQHRESAASAPCAERPLAAIGR
jgi:hypothetical protein